MSAPTTTMTQTHYDPHFVDMMRGTPPPTWESTCLKLEAKLADRNQYIKELEGRLRVLWDKYNSALDDITADSKENSESNAIIRELQLKIKRMEEAGNAMYDFINPPSPCLRTSRMDSLLQGWDDAKANK